MISFGVLCLFLASSAALLAPLKTSNGETDIDSVSNHVLLLEQMMSALTTKLSEQTKDLDATKNDLNVLKSQYQSLQSSVEGERKLREENDRNLTASVALMKTEVGYEVQLTNDITTQHDKEPLKFDHLRYNAGGGFHSTSGMFVAPVSGTYMFWCHVMNLDSVSIHIYLNHEGDIAAQAYLPTNHAYFTAAITTVLQVNKGDNVWFYKESGSSLLRAGYSSHGAVLIRAS